MEIFTYLTFLILVLLSVAFFTLLERKMLSLIGLRTGPAKVFFLGFFQPVVDALKLANKSENFLYNFSFYFYYLSSFFFLGCSLFLWSCYPSEPGICSINLGFMLLFCILALNSLNSILVGWSSWSKFSLIGSLRSVAQLISYEASLYLCFFFLFLCYVSYSFSFFFYYSFYFLVFLYPFLFFCWMITVTAELNRTPFDFSEGESELVSGFNTEFGSKCFTLVFLAEYSNVIFFCFLGSFLFFFFFKIFFLFFMLIAFIWIRATFARFRFDKLMLFCWTFLLPILTFMFLFYLSFSF